MQSPWKNCLYPNGDELEDMWCDSHIKLRAIDVDRPRTRENRLWAAVLVTAVQDIFKKPPKPPNRKNFKDQAHWHRRCLSYKSDLAQYRILRDEAAQFLFSYLRSYYRHRRWVCAAAKINPDSIRNVWNKYKSERDMQERKLARRGW